MRRLRESFRQWWQQPKFRPWGLLGPVLVIVVCLPMLRPLRHPTDVSDDEAARLATIQSLVEHRTLAVDRNKVPESQLVRRGSAYFSDQPPALAVILSGPYWIMARNGITFDKWPAVAPYLLTLICSTLPAAWVAALVYRMGRLFELSRPWRAGLAIAAVFGTGLLSYATVLNPHAPAATMLLAAAGCVVHVASSRKPRRGGAWFMLSGLCAALAVAFDPPAILIAAGLLLVILTMRVSVGLRIGGILLFLIGATPPLVLHSAASALSTGTFVPASVARDLHGRVTVAVAPSPMTQLDFEEDEDLANRSWWLVAGKYINRWISALVGAHGLLSHFPILIFGVAGVGAVMHRHWPLWTKTLAGCSAGGAVLVIGLYCFSQADWREAMFATRWFILFVPLMLYWAGAWLRGSHSPVTMALLGVLLAFSTAVSIIGATNPCPHEGFERYTAADALMQLINGKPDGVPPQVAAAQRK
jgi:hypothetical protein